MQTLKRILKRISERKNQIAAKISTMIATTFVTGLTALSANAAVADQITKKINSLQVDAKTIAWSAGILMCIFAGIAFMCGRSGKETGKSWLIGIAIGCLVVSVASSIIEFFKG